MSKKAGLSPIKLRKLRVQELMIKYYLQGMTLKEVSERLEVEKYSASLSTVSKYIKEAIEEWRSANNERLTEYKILELQKINQMENAAWEAWEASKLPQVTKNYKFVPGKTPRSKGKYIETGKSEKSGTGEPKFLLLVNSCIEKRLEIMAGLVPTEIEAFKTGATTITNTTVRRIIFQNNKNTGVKEMLAAEESITEEKKIENN